jgi:hypothetical protein
VARRDPPGIASLHRLIAEHGEAIEYDLLRLGLDIRDLGGALSYRRLRVILANSAPDSAYARSIGGDGWTLSDQLLGIAIDVLAAANWQRGGGKDARPKSIRPQANLALNSTDAAIISLVRERAARRKGA